VVNRQVALATGSLAVEIVKSQMPVDALIGFAARNNAKRGFLFVSKVLGKHWPATPAAMQASHDALAASLGPAHSNTLFIGMAETATGLGQGVFEACLRRGWQGQCLLSTRYPMAGDAEAIHFEEGHSHAPRVLLHWPKQAGLAHCTRLVLVDDEISTGQTFINLWRALAARLPAVQRIDVVCLTDFMGDGRSRFLAAMPAGTEVHALLTGSYRFTPNAGHHADAPAAQASPAQWRPQLAAAVPRLGVAQALTVRLPELPPNSRVLVLGVGELMHAGFVMGRGLAEQGHDVRVQSATRSPILLGHAIGQVLRLPDPYGEGIPYYLYNVVPGQYEQVLLLHETGVASVAPLAEALAARPLALQDWAANA
jgi:hypothetical protein